MNRKAALALMAGALLTAAQAFAQDYTFTLIDVRCDAAAVNCPAGLAPGGVASQTSVRGINARGDMVGFYVDGSGRQHGFLLHDGEFTTIDFPLAGVRATIANGINPTARSMAVCTAMTSACPCSARHGAAQ